MFSQLDEIDSIELMAEKTKKSFLSQDGEMCQQVVVAHNQPTTHSHTFVNKKKFQKNPTHNKWWLVGGSGGDCNKNRGTAATTSSLDAVRSPTGDGRWQPAPLNVAENSLQLYNPHTQHPTQAMRPGPAARQDLPTTTLSKNRHLRAICRRKKPPREKWENGMDTLKMLKCWGRSERNRLLLATHTNPRAFLLLKQPTLEEKEATT